MCQNSLLSGDSKSWKERSVLSGGKLVEVQLSGGRQRNCNVGITALASDGGLLRYVSRLDPPLKGMGFRSYRCHAGSTASLR